MNSIFKRIKFYLSVNWIKTVYFNFKMFPIHQAKKLPVYFYGKVKFASLKGRVVIEAPLKKGMIGFGQLYEMSTRSAGISELFLEGKLIFNGHTQFGKDYLVYIKKGASCEFGHMASIASNGKIICVNKIKLGDFARLGSESQIIDTNFHQMSNTITGEKYAISAPINIGSYNYIGNRVSIMSKTKTPNYCTIASNSLCNKDYSEDKNNILLGGIPAILLKKDITRDWEGEREGMEKFLTL